MSENGFNPNLDGWLKIMRSQLVEVLEAVYSTGDRTHVEIAQSLGKDEMRVLGVLTRLENRDLLESYEDSTMGPVLTRWRTKHTKKAIKKAFVKRLLVSVFKDWRTEAYETLIEELAKRPALVQAIKDAFP